MKIELPKVLLELEEEQDYQAVSTSEEDAEYGITNKPTLTRSEVVSGSHRRFFEPLGGCLAGFLVAALLFRHSSSSTNNMVVSNDTTSSKAAKPWSLDKEEDDTTTTAIDTIHHVLSLEERKKFALDPHENNITFYQQRKPTPSGWWPDAEWVQACVDNPRELSPFATLEEWVDYRLGDCVKICAGCPTDEDHPELAHWTIAGEYYDHDCYRGKKYHMKRGNETLLDEIIDKRQGQPGYYVPDPEAIVIHLRLGDKIEDSKASAFEMLQNSAEPGHQSFRGFLGVKSVYEFLTNVVTSEAPKVVIRGGSQLPNMYKKSKTYAYCLQEAFDMAGYETEINLEEGNADVDFNYMVHAKKLIVTVGGFSRFIGSAVLRRGGIVYGRVFR